MNAASRNGFGRTAAAACLCAGLLYGAASEASRAEGMASEGVDQSLCSPDSARDRPELRIDGVERTPSGDVERLEKLEWTVAVSGTVGENPYWPFDPNAPAGAAGVEGITVEAVIEAPDGQEHVQPAFYHQDFLEEIRQGKDWLYPTDSFSWRIRFAPDSEGLWHYTVRVLDRCGRAETERFSFYVTPSQNKGFVRVSQADSRYFEFEDGTPFHPIGFEIQPNLENPRSIAAPIFQELKDSGVTLARIWISSIYGSAWQPLVGGRNQYRGYLPVVGLLPAPSPDGGADQFALLVDYEPEGDTGYFDACRMEWLNPIAVKPNSSYRVAVEYLLGGVEGPRRRDSPEYGIVAKLGGWHSDCYEPGASTAVTIRGRTVGTWSTASGVWNSGENDFLPNLHVALENVDSGWGYISAVTIREIFEDGTLGPEIRPKASMQLDRYVSQHQALAFDRIVESAENAGVLLKVVLLDKGDEMWLKFNEDGSLVTGDDNLLGFYGAGREVNRTRWLQMAWWRYAQARWGYSAAIHSWELTNEGDPALVRHYELADEFARYMHEGVFCIAGDSSAEPTTAPLVSRTRRPRSTAPATSSHVNSHLATTSFWHSYPAAEFWASSKYPNIDYADLHAYVSTSFAPRPEKEQMTGDAAYFHLWHSSYVAGSPVGKPVMRGEAGLDSPDLQRPEAAGIERDVERVWLHNYVWSTLDSGALSEIYWWDAHVWDGKREDLEPFSRYAAFISDIPLNAGGYRDWGGSASDARLRVVGQKNTTTGRAHLWLQNSQHTWKNVVGGVAPSAVSATVRVPGFGPGSTALIQIWDTRSGAHTSETNATASGR